MSGLSIEAALQLAAAAPRIIASVEDLFAYFKKPGTTGKDKLNAAIAIASAAIPAVATSLATQPDSVSHAQSVINSAVAVANTFESFDHYLAAQQAASSGA